MCGIVGYIGEKRDARDVLLDGLKTLEYRGYDSAGVAMLNGDGTVKYVRAVGGVANLEKKLGRGSASGASARVSLGIAHTRWATHGKPSVANAHPHKAGNIYLVHNGIIENYQELRDDLKEKSCEFLSDTDSEVLAHLINTEYEANKDSLHTAVRKALARVQGAYAIAVIAFDNPDTLVAARMSSPLVIGVGDGEYIVASDASAIAPHTKRVIYLEDGEIAEIKTHSHKITTLENTKRHKKEQALEWNESEAKLAGYPHFMLKEIYEQPMSVTEALRGRVNAKTGAVTLGGLAPVVKELQDIKRIIITSCGTSYNAGLIGEYLFENIAEVATEVEYSSEFRYRNSPIDTGTAVLIISQSGETADSLSALHEAKKRGALTLGIVNAVGSTISRETSAGIYNHAGPEVSVASTKAFTSQISILILLTVFIGKQKKLKTSRAKTLLSALEKVPKLMNRFLKENEKSIKKIAYKYAKYDNMLYIARKYQFPVALEGALKIKEIAYIHAEGYPAGEMKHGPIALIDKNMPTVVLAPRDSVYKKTLGSIEEIKARGGKVLAITTADAKEVIKIADDYIIVPKMQEEVLPLLTTLAVQLLAYHAAIARGHNVDRPRNLAKSVTVE